MKKTFGFIGLATVTLLLSSCMTTVKTARTAETSAAIKNATVADLKVTDHRVTYTMNPSKSIQRGGLSNVKQAAIQEALTQNGNADVMVEPEFVIEKERTLFGTRINSITVSGRPAYYQNFRTLNDSVWATPGFYGQPNVVYVNKAPAHGNGGYGSYGAAKRSGLAGVVGGVLGKLSGRGIDRDGSARRTGLGFNIDLMGGYENTHSEYSGHGESHSETSDGKGYLGAFGTIGLQTNPHWFFGVGSGYMYGWDNETEIVPIFGDIRYYFSPQKSSFFIDYKIGGSFEVSSTPGLSGGLMLAPSFGYSVGPVSLALQFLYQEFGTEVSDLKVSSSHVGLTLGFKF